MAKQNAEMDFEKIFSLLTSQGRKADQELKSSFVEAFERQWKKADAAERQKMVRHAGELEVEDGLRPAMLGLRDLLWRVRDEAKKSVDKFAQQVKVPFKKAEDLPPHTIRRSAEFCFAIYREMKLASRNVDLMKFCLETLLSIGGRGPFYCWKFFTQGVVPHNIVIETIKKFPQNLQLIFVYQSTLDRIPVRRLHRSSVDSIIKDVSDRDTVVAFLSDLFDQDALLYSVFDDLCKRLWIQESVQETELKANDEKEKIKALKVLGLLGRQAGYHSCLPLLSHEEPLAVRIECLKMLARANAGKDPRVIQAVRVLLDDKDENVALRAFRTLVALRTSGLEKAACDLCQKYPSTRSDLYESLSALGAQRLNSVLGALPPDQKLAARATIVKEIIRNDPDKRLPKTMPLSTHLRAGQRRVF
jgi:hypothetical protein